MAPKKTAITNRIRELRFRTGELTQQQLADLAHVSRQTIVAVEKAKYAPSLELAFRLSRIFGVTVEDVFFYENGPEAE